MPELNETHMEVIYLERFAAECLRIIAKDRGDTAVDELIANFFRAYNTENAFLEAFDEAISSKWDAAGRAAVTRALDSARRTPDPILSQKP